MAARFKPKSDLESKVLTAVGSSGADNADMLGTADVQAQYKKLRIIMLQDQQKFKRMKKIKSKLYHKLKKKAK